jgi:signal transduction histidine kinase
LGLGRVKSLDELESYKVVAREEIDHALRIVEETLKISDINQPVQRPVTEVDLNEVVNHCLRLIDHNRYQIVLDLNQIPKLPGQFSDLQVVVTNLIHNAIEAMPEGGTMNFQTCLEGVKGNRPDRVVLRVEDNGAGIPPEIRSRVWEPYFSGKNGGDGLSAAGRGWGLTIVNRIISEHGGTIRLDSEVGVGTKFTITFPLNAAISSPSLTAVAAPKAAHA